MGSVSVKYPFDATSPVPIRRDVGTVRLDVDPTYSALFVRRRTAPGDLATSALPDAPQVLPAPPGPLRRAVAASLRWSAQRLDPAPRAVSAAPRHRTPGPVPADLCG